MQADGLAPRAELVGLKLGIGLHGVEARRAHVCALVAALRACGVGGDAPEHDLDVEVARLVDHGPDVALAVAAVVDGVGHRSFVGAVGAQDVTVGSDATVGCGRGRGGRVRLEDVPDGGHHAAGGVVGPGADTGAERDHGDQGQGDEDRDEAAAEPAAALGLWLAADAGLRLRLWLWLGIGLRVDAGHGREVPRGRVHGRIDRRVHDRRVHGRIDRRVHGRVHGRIDRRVHGRVHVGRGLHVGLFFGLDIDHVGADDELEGLFRVGDHGTFGQLGFEICHDLAVDHDLLALDDLQLDLFVIDDQGHSHGESFDLHVGVGAATLLGGDAAECECTTHRLFSLRGLERGAAP